jgi:hypothetical protein
MKARARGAGLGACFGACLATLFALLSKGALAQQALDANVSLRTEAWSGNRLLDDQGPLAAASAWASIKLPLGSEREFGELVGRGWLRSSTQKDGSAAGRLRELYWTHQLGPVSMRLGRQMMVWGRADGVNPTDNLTPSDFTLPTPEDGEQRHGKLGLSAKLPAGPGLLTVAWFAHAASHTIALPPMPGLRYTVERPPRRPQTAVKWDATLGDIDGSLSYVDGTDLWPDLNIAGVSASGVEVLLRNQRARILGADISTTRNGVVWRAEAAWLRPSSDGPQDFRHKKPQLWAVGGGEWTLPSGLTLGLQASAKQVFDFVAIDTIADPISRAVAQRQAAVAGQTARRQLGLIWRVAQRVHDDKLSLEASGIVLGPPRNGLVRVQADYAWSDDVHLRAGAVSSFGSPDTQLGQLKANALVYLQLRFGFSFPSPNH